MSTQTVLLTGAGGGLGTAVTDAFLEAGWRVVVPELGETAGRVRTRHAATGAVEVIDADLTDPDSVAAAVRVAAGVSGAPLRAVVNLVGGYAGGGRVHETPVDEFESMLRLNLRPTYLVTAAALPALTAAGGGAVVCVSSRAAQQPFPGAAGYAAAKAAVLAFAGAVAVEYADAGVRCNAVVPTVIDTPANRAAMPDADHSKWTPPSKIARVIRFLASDESAPVTGAAVPT